MKKKSHIATGNASSPPIVAPKSREKVWYFFSFLKVALFFWREFAENHSHESFFNRLYRQQYLRWSFPASLNFKSRLKRPLNMSFWPVNYWRIFKHSPETKVGTVSTHDLRGETHWKVSNQCSRWWSEKSRNHKTETIDVKTSSGWPVGWLVVQVGRTGWYWGTGGQRNPIKSPVGWLVAFYSYYLRELWWWGS